MPYADSAQTAHRWATERTVALWALFAGDLAAPILTELAGALAAARADGARVALIGASEAESGPDAQRLKPDVIVHAPAVPSPFGLFTALERAGVSDVRRLGVLGGTASALDAGHRAGASVVVGIAVGPAHARELLRAQPDAVIAPAGFAALDAERCASDRAHRQRVLLNPGPSVVSDRVHRAAAGPDLCHREPEYTALFTRVRRKLLDVAGVSDDWGVGLLAGSGTAAMEAMVAATVRPERTLLVCRNGTYGERLDTMARRLGHRTVSVDAPQTEPIDPRAVDAALAAHPDVDAVAVVHHETTTGLLNPVPEIAAVAHARGVLTAVDAISSLGAEDLPLADGGIDFVACTANKCLHGLPGASFVLVSPRGQARAVQAAPRSLYLDLANYLRAQAAGTVPFTPGIPAIYALEAALDELIEGGLDARKKLYRQRMAYLDGELERLGLHPLVAPQHRSHSVRSLPLPDGVDYDTLHDAVKRDGYVIYAGLGTAAQRTFRVCALGALEVDALRGFVASLEASVARATDAA
jgi:2-aminoethylphosphonate-pyruvate transaminase